MQHKLDQDKIGFLLSIWEGLIKYDAFKQRTDSSKSSEIIFMDLMNIIRKEKHEDLNKPGSCGGIGKINFPGIDVGVLNNVGYSITSEYTADKIYRVLETFEKNPYAGNFPKGIKIVFLNSQKKLKPTKAKIERFKFFNAETDIYNLKDIHDELSCLSRNEHNRFKEAMEFLSKELMAYLPLLFDTRTEVNPLDRILLVVDKFNNKIENFRSNMLYDKSQGVNALNNSLVYHSNDVQHATAISFINLLNPILNEFAIGIQPLVSINQDARFREVISSVDLSYKQIKKHIDLFYNKAKNNQFQSTEVRTFISIVEKINNNMYPPYPFI